MLLRHIPFLEFLERSFDTPVMYKLDKLDFAFQISVSCKNKTSE